MKILALEARIDALLITSFPTHIYICVCSCIYVCVYIYVYIYMCISIYMPSLALTVMVRLNWPDTILGKAGFLALRL